MTVSRLSAYWVNKIANILKLLGAYRRLLSLIQNDQGLPLSDLLWDQLISSCKKPNLVLLASPPSPNNSF